MAEIVFWDQPDITDIPDPPAVTFFGGQGPDFPDNPWDTVFIDGQQLPGLCRVEGLPTLKIDQKKKGGADAITFTATGYLPGPISVEITIWTASQWEIFVRLAKDGTLWRKPRKKAKAKELAKTISHPALALWGITQIIVQGVSTPEHGPIKFSKVVKLRCLEYVPPDKDDHTKTAKAQPNFPANSPKFPAGALNAAARPSDAVAGPRG